MCNRHRGCKLEHQRKEAREGRERENQKIVFCYCQRVSNHSLPPPNLHCVSWQQWHLLAKQTQSPMGFPFAHSLQTSWLFLLPPGVIFFSLSVTVYTDMVHPQPQKLNLTQCCPDHRTPTIESHPHRPTSFITDTSSMISPETQLTVFPLTVALNINKAN